MTVFKLKISLKVKCKKMGDNGEKASLCVDAHFHGSAQDGTISTCLKQGINFYHFGMKRCEKLERFQVWIFILFKKWGGGGLRSHIFMLNYVHHLNIT